MKHRLPQLGVLLVGAAFLGYWALLVYCDLGKPSPFGVFLSANGGGIQVDAVVPGGQAEGAGLRVGDRITGWDGHPVSSRMDWVAVETNVEIGRAMRLSVDRQGIAAAVSIVPELASWPSWRLQHGPEVLVVRTVLLVTLLVALLVAMKRPRDPAALVGAAFLATIGVFSVTLPYRFASTWRALPTLVSLPLWIPFISCVGIAAWGFSFFANFPRRRFHTRLAWGAVLAPIVPGLIGQGIFGYYAIVLGRPAPIRLPWAESLIVVGVAYVVSALALLVSTYQRLTDVNERRRVRIVLIGSLVGALAGIPVVLSYWHTSTNNLGQPLLASPAATAGALLFLVLPLSFAYAILRHRLFDVSVIIRQGLRYVMARHAVLGVLPAMLVVVGVDLLAHGSEPVGALLRKRLWIYAALAGVAAAARMQQHRWLSAIDRRFFRERYNGQRLLRQVAEDVRQADSLYPVAPAVVARIEQALHPAFVALLVRDPAGRRYRTVASSPHATAPVELDWENKVLTLASLLGKPLEIAEFQTTWLERKMPGEDVGSIRAAAIALIVPVASGSGDTPAFFVLGPKRSEEPFTDDDGELLMAVAESVALRLPGIAPAPAAGVDRFEECPACGACCDAATGRCPADGAALAPVNIPRLLCGRYRLERRLGRGGMGTVYVASDTLLDRSVAVKLVREELIGQPGAAERFQREARTQAAFSHPNVVTVHDFGVTGAHAFLVMELLDGPTLRETLRVQKRIEAGRALALLRDITAAVDAAHRRQIVHRDLKPENICLVAHESGERAKVLDFGLAKFLAPRDGEPFISHTTDGAIIGTPLYMAPEQLRGEEPGPGWDLWALAVIAFEMLSGSHPFASVAFSSSIHTSGAAADSRLLHLPDGSHEFFAHALAIDPALRPASAALFIAGLERSLHG